MEVLRLKRISETYDKVICDPGVAQELRQHFTFDVPGAKFMPAFKNKIWDGKIRLFNNMTCQLYGGLRIYLEKFCRDRGYTLEYIDDYSLENFSLLEATEFTKDIGLPVEYQPRDYQLEAFAHAVRNRRTILLSPTGSGKSFIIYLLVRYYEQFFEGHPNHGSGNALIIVPTTSLVSQLAGDFADYGFDSDKRVHCIYSGQEKVSSRPVTISTWQSIYKLPKSFFESFDVVIGDEVHLFTAKSLKSIMEKLDGCKYRFGTTGTLDGTKTNRLVLEGLFGPVKKVTTTSQLIEKKHLSDFKIKAIVLQYPDEVRKLIKKMDYQQELDWIVTCEARNRFITNLALSLKGNTLLLFQFVEKHGKVLQEMVRKKTNQPVYFIHGSVEGEEREQIRRIVEKEKDAIIIASSGTFSTGVNIRNLHNVIFASPSKSRVRNLQSIGRVLRTSESKDSATLFDIADEMTSGKEINTTMKHFRERIKIYNEENFVYKIYPVKLEV